MTGRGDRWAGRHGVTGTESRCDAQGEGLGVCDCEAGQVWTCEAGQVCDCEAGQVWT